MANIKVNGKIIETDLPKTISEFLQSINVNAKRCVVEYNGKAMKASEFENVELKDGDVLEVMSIVAGG